MRSLVEHTLLLSGLLLGCGGASARTAPVSHSSYDPAPVAAADRSLVLTPEDAMIHDGGVVLAAEPVDQAPGDQREPVPMPPPVVEPKPIPPPAPPPARAAVGIKMLRGGQEVGFLTFTQNDRMVTIAGNFTGLPPGEHGFFVHEKGLCSGKGAIRAGNHFNPTGARHGPPESSERHAGDFGNLVVDKAGNATFAMSTDSITIDNGADSVLGRAIVIHARRDDGKTQPSGRAGAGIACGVISIGARAEP